MAGSRMLVVYYSRSGTTRKIAEALSEALTCDLEEIVETKSRAGIFGYMRSLVEARQKRPSVIAPAERDASAYDLVVVGTPVWGWSVSSPVRAYLMTNRDRLPEVAFFCTLGGAGGASTFAQMQGISGKTPRAVVVDHTVFVPIARLFDHGVREHQEARGDGDAKGLGGLQVDDQLELHRLLHRQVFWLGPSQDAIHVVGRTPVRIRPAWRIGLMNS
jgi:NAD(P)H-dependent FMN reductase